VQWPVGYTKKSEVLERPFFKVEAECAQFWTGDVSVTACEHDGHHYKISGCKREKCKVPDTEAAYKVTVADRKKPLYRPWDEKGIKVECSAGYFGQAKFGDCEGGESLTPLKLSGSCEPIVCKAPTPMKEYTVADAGMVLDLPTGVKVEADCAAGYTGTAEFHPCKANDDPVTLSGCKPAYCRSPQIKLGFKVEKEVRDLPNFAVKAKCDDGFIGTAAAEPCKKDDDEYVLGGCQPIKCQSPASTVGYQVAENALEAYQFAVTVQCAVEFVGTAKAKVCEKNMDEYKLEGCTVQKCAKPSDTAGYKITEHSVDRTNFAVEVECEEDRIGTATVTECGDPTDKDTKPAYKLAGCKKK